MDQIALLLSHSIQRWKTTSPVCLLVSLRLYSCCTSTSSLCTDATSLVISVCRKKAHARLLFNKIDPRLLRQPATGENPSPFVFPSLDVQKCRILQTSRKKARIGFISGFFLRPSQPLESVAVLILAQDLGRYTRYRVLRIAGPGCRNVCMDMVKWIFCC